MIPYHSTTIGAVVATPSLKGGFIQIAARIDGRAVIGIRPARAAGKVVHVGVDPLPAVMRQLENASLIKRAFLVRRTIQVAAAVDGDNLLLKRV